MKGTMEFSCNYMASLSFLYLSMSLLHLDHLQACRIGRKKECDRAPFVPGHNLVGEGIDVVKLEHKSAYVIDMLTYLRPNETCILCSNNLMGNQAQKLPFTVLDWRPITVCDTSISSFFSNSVSSLLASSSSLSIENNWKLGLKLNKFFNLQLAGSKSDLFKFASARQKEDKKTSFTSHQLTCTHYHYRVPWKPPLSPEFLQHVKSLPQTYSNDTTDQYQSFIDTYGTHFIHQVKLGGTFKMVTSIRTCLATLVQQMSTSQVMECLSAGFSVGLGQVTAFQASLSSDSCKKVLNNLGSITGNSLGFLDHLTMVSGGDTWPGMFIMTQNDSAIHEWLRSIKSKPALVSYKIRPLHDLVKNKFVRGHLQRAIREYIEKNALPIEERPTCSGTNLSPNCCPLSLHRGWLTVTVIRAWALNIDWFGPKEIHIRVFYGGVEHRTWEIRSYDPIWNANYNYGHIHTGHTLRLETYYRSRMIGGCHIHIQQGSHQHDCWMHIGVFTYSYNLQCDTQLTGPQCNIYLPSP